MGSDAWLLEINLTNIVEIDHTVVL